MTGAEIRAIRASLKLNQHDLADRLGVNIMSISRWENGERNISRRMEKALLQLKAIEEIKERLLPSP